MSDIVSQGSLVVSIAGHDKGKLFLVVDCIDKFVYLADGKLRKITALKKKNIKHIKLVTTANLKEFADRIKMGKPVGNEKLHKAIKTQIEKIQED